MNLGFLNRQRLWTVYRPTGDPKRPLKPVACVRANAKSIAAGKVVDLDPKLRNDFSRLHVRKARRDALVVVEGCFTSGPVLRGGLGSSIARVQKRWQIRGRRPDGKKLAFPVQAYDIFEAGRIAEKKARGGRIEDIVLIERRR